MKRILSMVLALMMILGMVPAVAAAEYAVVDKIPVTLDTSVSYSPWGTPWASYTWYPMYATGDGQPDGGTWGAWSADSHYAEVVADGYQDAGALHLKSNSGKNVSVAIHACLTVEQTYTIGLWAKGTSNSGRVLASYGNGDFTIINTHADLGTDWTYYEASFTANLNQFNLMAADWGVTDIYVDNITIKDANGVDMLQGAGNFYTYSEVTKDTEVTRQWPDYEALDASAESLAYNFYIGQWTQFRPTSESADYPAWVTPSENAEQYRYAEIVANGYKDAGSLHISRNSNAYEHIGVAIGADMQLGATYTLKMAVKSTITAPWGGLQLYGNGDGKITELGDGTAIPNDGKWHEVSTTFTADRFGVAFKLDGGSYSGDVYIDNVQLIDANGNDMISGCGDFYTSATKTYYTVMQEKAVSIIPADNGTVGAWYNNGSTFATDAGSANYIEIVSDGCKDAGALHVYQDMVANNDMGLGMFLGGQAAGNYTLKFQVKGKLGTYSDQTCKFYIPGVEGQIANLTAKLGTLEAADWTEVSYDITVSSDFYYLIFGFSKYNWAADIYIDNVQLINASGVNVLGNAGNFCVLEEVTVSCEDTNQWPDDSDLDTATISGAYGGTLTNAWTPMYPAGAADEGTWAAWDAVHYAEISANGYKDAGSLHLVSCPGKNTGIAINAGMTAGETYTLGFYAKGTVNTGKVLGMYDNGNGTIIADTASFGAGWNYYEHTFTAGLSQINLVAADWGWVDIYLDNITLKNSAGVDLLDGCGDFYRNTKEVPEPEEPEEPTEPEVTEPEVEGLAVIGNELERAYHWYWNGVTYEETDHSKVEIAPYGAEDNGSLHIWQSSAAPSDTVLGLVTSMASDLDSGSYTLSMNVKGVFYNTEGFYVHPAYSGLSDAQFAYLSVNKNLATAEGVSCVDGAYITDGWINLQWTLPANPEDGENGFMFLTLQFSKYNVGEYFIDNIQVLDTNGNDVLGGAGSFMDSGSEYFPIILPSTGAEILNSNTMYYQISAGERNVSVSNHTESGITCGDQNFTVTHNGVTQSASNKNVTMQMAPAAEGEPIVFAVTSTASSLDVPGNAFEMMQRAGEFNIYDVVVAPYGCIHSYSDWNVTAAPTYTVAGSQSKTCALCGDVVTEEIPVLANPVTSWNITLKDNIGVNFVMALADADVVTATVDGNAVDCTVADGKLSINVAAAQMMDEISISVNGLPLANTYSVREYADTILADNSLSDCHELVKNMLVYGGAAQTYFNHKSSNLASNGIEVSAAVPSGEADMNVSGRVNGINFYGASLVCRDKIAVRFYFTGSIEGLTFSQGKPVQKGDMYYIEIADICPQDLDVDQTVSVTDGTNTLSVAYAPMDYIIRMYAKGGNTAALVQALYGYYLAVEAYTA